jgi:hypothetical protein
MDGEATRVGDAIVINEGATKASVQFKAEQRAETVPIGTGRARNDLLVTAVLNRDCTF